MHALQLFSIWHIARYKKGVSKPFYMAQYSLLINKKGTILSITAMNVDPKKFPVRKLMGRHFSHLIGTDCKKDLRYIMQEISKTRQAGCFGTFSPASGDREGPVLEWTIQPKFGNILMPVRYLLIGKEPG
jgi:hypothetical protein